MANPVFLWIPNLVGYARVVFMVVAFYLCFDSPLPAAVCYAISQGLDAVDGMVARHFGQCSKYGAVLDMLTDRMSTAVLLIVLALQYPHMWGFFAFLVVLDIVSHWFQMYAKLAQKSATHKGSKNPALNFYYTAVMSFWPRLPWMLPFCVGNEAFLLALYMLSFTSAKSEYHTAYTSLALVAFPLFAAKQFFNVVQLFDAAGEVADADYAEHQKAKTTRQ